MADFYQLVIATKEARIFGGPWYGTEYTLTDACSLCGAGAEPVGPRIVPKSAILKAPVFCTLLGEVLVGLDMTDGLKALGVESLADVRAVKTGEELPLKELRAEATLPPFSKETTGYERERACPKCGRDGYFNIPHVPLRLVYRNLAREYASKKVLATYERFGNSRLREPFKDSVFAAPVYVVSAPVASYLKEKGKRRITLEPVDITWAE